MVNKRSLKFMFGFFGILLLAMVVLVLTSYFDQNEKEEIPAEMNLAGDQV